MPAKRSECLPCLRVVRAVQFLGPTSIRIRWSGFPGRLRRLGVPGCSGLGRCVDGLQALHLAELLVDAASDARILYRARRDQHH